MTDEKERELMVKSWIKENVFETLASLKSTEVRNLGGRVDELEAKLSSLNDVPMPITRKKAAGYEDAEANGPFRRGGFYRDPHTGILYQYLHEGGKVSLVAPRGFPKPEWDKPEPPVRERELDLVAHWAEPR